MKLLKLFTSSVVLASSLFAVDVPDAQKNDLEQLNLEKEYINSVVPKSKIAKYEKAEMDGLYKVYFENGQMFYVNPFKKLIFFGEIYNNKGYSYTQTDRNKWQQELSQTQIIDKYKASDFKKVAKSLKYGTGGKDYEFVIFTDPECPYCKMAESLIATGNTDLHLIFSPLDFHKNAENWSKIILSAKDTKKAMEDIKNGNIPTDIAITKDAENKLAEMMKLSQELNVPNTGTPKILIIDKKQDKIIDVINGADEKKIRKYM